MSFFKKIKAFFTPDGLMRSARKIYFVIAFIAFALIILALITTIVSQLFTIETSYDETPVPKKYVSTGMTPDLSVINKRLSPPVNVRFVPIKGIFLLPIKIGQVLGYVRADSPNDLAKFPGDLAIIGGVDGSTVDRAKNKKTGQSVLTFSSVLVDEINNSMKNSPDGITRSFDLTVLMYDEFLNRSEPINLNFSIQFTSNKKDITNPGIVTPDISSTKPKTLQDLALRISTFVDPSGTDKQFAAYKRAMEIPTFCIRKESEEFISFFSNSFSKLKSEIQPVQIEAFYLGVCDAWKTAIASEEKKAAQVEAKRNAVEESNMKKFAVMKARVTTAKIVRNYSIAGLSSAIGVFLLICIIFAFMRIEDHYRAIRDSLGDRANVEKNEVED